MTLWCETELVAALAAVAYMWGINYSCYNPADLRLVSYLGWSRSLEAMQVSTTHSRKQHDRVFNISNLGCVKFGFSDSIFNANESGDVCQIFLLQLSSAKGPNNKNCPSIRRPGLPTGSPCSDLGSTISQHPTLQNVVGVHVFGAPQQKVALIHRDLRGSAITIQQFNA